MISYLLFATLLAHATPAAAHPLADEWTSLDQEIAALAEPHRAAQAPVPGIAVNGWIRTRYAHSSDVDADPSTAGDQDLGGFNLDSVRLLVRGTAAEGYGFLISFDAGDEAVNDAASDGVGIVDAYATLSLGDYATLTMGSFCSMFLANTCVEERNLLFLDRSFLDEAWDWRDLGVQLSGAVQRFEWWAAIQNGMDDAADESAWTARASVHIIGEGLCTQEGCPTGVEPSELLTVGVAWYDDQSMDEGAALGADVLFAWKRLSAVAEIVDHEEEMRPGLALNPSTGVLIPMDFSATGPETPWGVTLGYLLVPERWEIGLRWQDLDDEADTSSIGAVLNLYFAGHDAKWTAQLDSVDSDDSALDAETIAVGLTVGV
jgi:hypothetical protein